MSCRSLRINPTGMVRESSTFRVGCAHFPSHLVYLDASQVAFLTGVVPDQIHQTIGIVHARQVMHREPLLARFDDHRADVEQAVEQALVLDIYVLNPEQLDLVAAATEKPGVDKQPPIGQLVEMPEPGTQDLPAEHEPEQDHRGTGDPDE